MRIDGIYYGESLTAAGVLLTDAQRELYEVHGADPAAVYQKPKT